MNVRIATIADIPQMEQIRGSVKENVLSNPALVTRADYITYITQRGRGWVGEINGSIVGFAVVDLLEHNVWALFVEPEFEQQGLGRQLHDVMLDWYFKQTNKPLWLSTSPGTRAEGFYRKAGWVEVGTYGRGELKFEMTSKR